MSNSATNNVSVISDKTLKVIANVAVGTAPKGLDYDPAHGNIWVANSGGTSLNVINDTTHSVVGTTSGLTTPTRPENDALDGNMWVTENTTHGAVGIVGLTNFTLWKTLRAGTNSVGIADLVPGGSSHDLMFVTNYGSANVTVFNMTTLANVATIPVGTHPEAVDCIDAYHVCAVANLGDGTVSLINTTSLTVSSVVTVGAAPIGVGADPALLSFFVTNSGSNTVSVVSIVSNSVTSTLNVGPSPHGATANDPVNGYQFISNYGSDNVSVIFDGTGGTNAQAMPTSLDVFSSNNTTILLTWFNPNINVIDNGVYVSAMGRARTRAAQ